MSDNRQISEKNEGKDECKMDSTFNVVKREILYTCEVSTKKSISQLPISRTAS